MLKYEAVINDITDKISSGVYKPNDKIPTTMELCEQYGVSKTTIKKAMNELENRGLVARRRGSGTFVKSLTPSNLPANEFMSQSAQMQGFTREHDNREGGKVSSVVYEFTVEHPNAEVAKKLSIDPDEFVYRICRVRCLDGVPLVIEHTWMPINLIPDLRMKNLEGSIYGYIEDTLKLKISSAHRAIRAVIVPEDELEKLDVPKGSPALEVNQVGFLDDGVAFEYSVSRHVRDYTFFSVSTH